MPAMKIAMSVLACAVVLLAGCGMADQYATFVPKILRQPSTEPPAPEPEPDVKEMVRAGADTLFTAHPTAVAVSRPHRMAGRGFSACVKAVVVGPMNPDPQPITLLVTIDHGKFTDRHRATEQDGCATESYERVEVRDCQTRPEQKAAQSDNLAAFAACRRGLLGGGCTYARCRSLQTISHYGMGFANQPWALPRSHQCGSWMHAASSGIPRKRHRALENCKLRHCYGCGPEWRSSRSARNTLL
jgi:hypothetical protein